MQEKLDNDKLNYRVDPTLLSNFVHQIIAPLNAVIGNVDNMLDGTLATEKVPQRLTAMRGQLVTTIELVRNLAYLSELQTKEGQQGLKDKAAPVVLPEIIIEAAQFFKSNAEQRGLAIHLQNREIQYTVRGHRDLLRQVFSNMFENAVKYSDEKTRVEASIHTQKRTNMLIVEVTNTGPGFRESEKAHLFDLSFRGADARALRANGSKLGLAICKNILDIHNATIEAEHSQARRKTTFRIRFANYAVSNQRGK